MTSSLHSERYDQLRALLIEQRKAAGLTQATVAERLNKPQSYVSKYENGKRRLDVIELIDIAAAIGFDPTTAFSQLGQK